MNLSESEQNALDWLRQEGGEMLTSKIEEKNYRDVFGCTVPGMGVFKKLEKKGLVYFTEEDPIIGEDGSEFTFTNSVCLVTTS
jgi:hypothetical protein